MHISLILSKKYDLKDSIDITKLLLLVETLLYIAFIGNNFMSNKTFIIIILFFENYNIIFS